MKYSNIEEAMPMIDALQIVRNQKVNPEAIDLTTLGKTFFDEFRKMDFNRKWMAGCLKTLSAEESIKQWVYFSDIAMQSSAEEAFGFIVGARDTNSWVGIRYFLQRPHIKGLIDISNATPMFLPIYPDYELGFQDIEYKSCSKYLNMHCIYLDEHQKQQNGYISSFNAEGIHIKNGQEKFYLKNEELESRILSLSENEETLAFSIAITASK